MTTSLMLSSKSRVILSCILDLKRRVSEIDTASVLHRETFGDNGSPLASDDFFCGMITPNQPWIIPRAQWENDAGDDIQASDFQLSSRINAWSSVKEHASDAGARDDLLIITAGITCEETGYTKAIERTYNGNGMLSAVVLQTGRATSS
jgi:hypothetical protein